MSGFFVLNIRGDTHMTSALREGGGGRGVGVKAKIGVIGRRGVGGY